MPDKKYGMHSTTPTLRGYPKGSASEGFTVSQYRDGFVYVTDENRSFLKVFKNVVDVRKWLDRLF